MSVIVPLIVAVTHVGNRAQFLVLRPGSRPFFSGFPAWIPEIMIVPLVLGALVPLALRMRRLAALAAAGLLIWFVSSSVGHPAAEAGLILAVGLQAVALAASAGPRRGLQILTWKHATVVVIATLLACCTSRILDPAARLGVIAVIGAAMALASPLGRRLLLLLAIPGYPLVLVLFVSLLPPGLAILPGYPALLAACYLPSLALAAVAARRASTRSSKPARHTGRLS